MRRSRRNGQWVRAASTCARSHATTSNSSSWPARAITRPPGSATKLEPQNSSPPSGPGSSPTRFTAATKQPLAIAWERWIVSHADCCRSPNSAFSGGSHPIAVG